MLNTLENRIKYLATISEKIQTLDLHDDINLFVFGSFITNNFKLGESDIDIAIYSKNVIDYLDILELLQDEFATINLDSDIFRVYENVPSAVYYAALNSPIQFTDYFPENLVRFKQKCFECM